MPIAQNPWVDRDHNGPAKPNPDDTNEDTAEAKDTNEDTAEAKDTPSAPINPLLAIARGRQMPKG